MEKTSETSAMSEEGAAEQRAPSNVSNEDVEMEISEQTDDVQWQVGPAPEFQERLLVHLSGVGEAPVCTVIINRKEEKPLPNYGGYRDTRSGVRYLNAIAQTELDKKAVQKKKDAKITRENLKPEQRKAAQQTDRETWTQMDRPGVILDNRGDYVLIPGPYFMSDDWDLVRVEAAIIIQKYVRRSIARRTAHRMRAYAKERKEFWEEQERIRKLEAEEHLKYEIQRRMNPRSGDDFEILYTELASWCAQELNKINALGKAGMERRKAVEELLLKEIKLLQTIDKLRCKAARENKKERISGALSKMCIPKVWELSNGSIVHVKTLGTTRATDLMNDERDCLLSQFKGNYDHQIIKWSQAEVRGLSRKHSGLIETMEIVYILNQSLILGPLVTIPYIVFKNHILEMFSHVCPFNYQISQSNLMGLMLDIQLYNALAKPIATNDERMGVLGYVKWTVQVFHTTLTTEILELIEREADLMMRGRPAKSLSGLRLRILNLFLQFIETPEFNPEAASQQYVPVDFDYGANSCPTRKRGAG